MAWRVLRSGPMIEVVIGHQDLPNGGRREVTTTRTGVGGEVIENDLGESLRTRYEAEDPYVRSIVEYGEIEAGDVDDDGNPTRVFVAKGLALGDEEPPATDEEAVERVREAEEITRQALERVQELQTQLQDVETARDEAVRENEQLKATAGSTLSYDDLDKDALAAQAKAQNIPVTRADGKEGDPLKSDYVTALEGARTGS